MRIALLSGWGVSKQEALETGRSLGIQFTKVILPNPNWREQLDAMEPDHVMAYSTGALLLLSEDGFGLPKSRVTLLAPFSEYVKEAGRGGQVRLVQLRYLLRWLRRAPLSAVNDFRERAGIGPRLEVLPDSAENLVWGVERLIQVKALGGDRRLYKGWVGELDPLLDAGAICAEFPFVQSVRGVGHELGGLLKAVRIPE